MRTIVSALLLLLPTVAEAQKAQKKWTSIGKTSSGNEVFVDAKSVKRTGDVVAATVRVVFTPPVQTPKGSMMSSRTTAMFDCAKKRLAAKETYYYGDAKETKVIDSKVNAIPGYGPALGGSMGALALEHLCAKR